jgi:ribonuclease HI
MVFLNFDGACEPFNPGGHGGWGVWIEGLPDGPQGLCGYVGYGDGVTNNVAEYTGLIRGLEFLVSRGVQSCEVRGDSQLAIRQMTGEYAVKSPLIRPLWQEAMSLASRIPGIRFRWVRRQENSKADLWSRYGLYLSVLPKARDVLDRYSIRVDGGIRLFRDPEKTDTWHVRKDSKGLYVCSCPAFGRSRINVCKHATAAWMLDHGQGGPAPRRTKAPTP